MKTEQELKDREQELKDKEQELKDKEQELKDSGLLREYDPYPAPLIIITGLAFTIVVIALIFVAITST